MSLIAFEDVWKVYDEGKPNEHAALRGVSFSIEAGGFISVTGPSGCGKSTLLNLLGALDTPTRGEYRLDGETVSGLTTRQLVRIRREKIGFIFQNFNLLPRLRAIDNVELPLVYRRLSRQHRFEKARRALEQVGLRERMAYRPSELSGGEQQRVAVARAIVGDPAIILADEPTGNLDSKTGGEIVDLLVRLYGEGRTVIIVTHDERIASVAQRRIRLLDGNIDN